MTAGTVPASLSLSAADPFVTCKFATCLATGGFFRGKAGFVLRP